MEPFTAAYERRLSEAWHKFIKGEEHDYSFIRPEILASWQRSRANGVDPWEIAVPHSLDKRETRLLLERNQSLLQAARPQLMKIYDILKKSGYYIFLCDAEGYILDLIYDDEIMSRYEQDESLVVGANRSEDKVGTNAIGTVLATGEPVQLWGEEHYIKGHKSYTCTGAPIRGPEGRIIGCLSFTGHKDSIQEHTLGVIISTISIIENDLRKQKLSKPLRQTAPSYTFDSIIGESAGVRRAKKLGRRIARTDSAVLIHGESGTGKELFAQAIHNESGRRHKPFVAINCGAIPEDLIESELFGYAYGAFTGAVRSGKLGKLEAASGGTLFLDEVESMPMSAQIKLLRALSSNSITRIGSVEEIPIDIRIISATKKDLLDEADAGRFREDLYFRINVITLALPPLREREADVRLLADHYIARFADKFSLGKVQVEEAFYQALDRYDWRGNVRELRNVIEGVMALAERGQPIEMDDLPARILQASKAAKAPPPPSPLPDTDLGLDELELFLIERELKKTGGNITQAAKNLGIARSTLYTKLRGTNLITKEGAQASN